MKSLLIRAGLKVATTPLVLVGTFGASAKVLQTTLSTETVALLPQQASLGLTSGPAGLSGPGVLGHSGLGAGVVAIATGLMASGV